VRPARLWMWQPWRMLDILAPILPPGLSAGAVISLLALSFLGSFATVAFGAGGGAFLLVAMTAWMPVTAAIPLHGVIQAGSNLGRALVTLGSVRWPLFGSFAAGAVLGGLAGSQLVLALPAAWVEAILGAFILYSLWGPTPVPRGASRGILAGVGAVTTALTLLVGATGPLVAASLRVLGLPRFEYVGTFATCMTLQHAVKIAAFGLLGFSYARYAGFLAAMIAAGFMGTLLGRRALRRMPERLFREALRLLLTLLALRLVLQAVCSLTAR